MSVVESPRIFGPDLSWSEPGKHWNVPMHVTATNRLARELDWIHDRAHVERGETTWRSADVLPYPAWLALLWNDGPPGGRVLLTASRERTAWERTIRASAEGSPSSVLDVSATAREAMEAWQLLHEWHCPLDESPDPALAWHETPDTEVFLDWAKSFRRLLDSAGWITRAELESALCCAIGSGGISVDGPVEFHGFLERTPARATLVAALEQSGVSTREHAADETGSNREAGGVSAVSAMDEEDEVRLAASWARHALETRGAEPPGDRVPVGIVVPRLEEYRSRIDRVFGETFHPDRRLDAASDPGRVFNVSLGPRLADHPSIGAALTILGCRPDCIPLETAGAILRSPFLFSGRGEASVRAEVDAALRREREPVVESGRILSLARRWAGDCPGLVRLLHAWPRAFSDSGRHVPSTWAGRFSTVLEAVGWPGEPPVSSVVHQTLEAWDELIRDFSSLDDVTGPVEWSAAVRNIRNMAAEVQFQVKSGRAPIQVLGVLEAVGMGFERLWVMGSDDAAWPGAAAPNPFLPVRLQRALGLPRSSPEARLEAAERIEDVLVGSAGSTVVSFSRHSGDIERRPSRFVARFAPIGREILADAVPSYAALLGRSVDPEILVDEFGPPLDEPGARGGTAVFRDQAACGFRAFAIHRLGAVPLERAEPGLDNRDRGELVHRALERVWSDIGSLAALRALSAGEIEDRALQSARAAVDELAGRRSVAGRERFRRLEEQRLTRLLVEWLELERERAPFTVVAREGRETAEIGGIRFDLRPDRVDRLADGSLVLIDYKTGVSGPGRWWGERPDEPQLPLYAVAHAANAPVGGVYFAILRPGQTGFRGIADTPDVAPGTEVADEPMDVILERWGRVVERLGQAFSRAEARVDPKSAATCRHCALPGFCRVDGREGGDV